uniref:Uncharacterized protein n=1 Tax=Anguilla anguilla TaxID=7936 RepID=A0A0E9RNJ5_ANGAN
MNIEKKIWRFGNVLITGAANCNISIPYQWHIILKYSSASPVVKNATILLHLMLQTISSTLRAMLFSDFSDISDRLLVIVTVIAHFKGKRDG